LDYIKGGCTINLMVAVDFTGSNGDPSSPGTLHYRFAGGQNQYQQAIRSIGNILAPYDSDNMIPVWGFGGRVFGEVSHCFALTFDEAAPDVQGVEGIMRVYDNAFKNVTLSGPTLFSQIIQTATVLADEPFDQEKQHYNILLILTDGVINDMAGTLAAIKQGAKTPLSIIIVGIGEADFTDMEKLDGDDEKDAKFRDIVQFVPFRNYAGGHISMLAKETLSEVPGQFLAFMKSKNISPNPARKAVEPTAPTLMESPSSMGSSMGSASVGPVTPVATDEAPPAFGDLMIKNPSGPPIYGQF